MPANQPKRDYYETLGADRAATRDQIKQAYCHLALKYHPEAAADDHLPLTFLSFQPTPGLINFV